MFRPNFGCPLKSNSNSAHLTRSSRSVGRRANRPHLTHSRLGCRPLAGARNSRCRRPSRRPPVLDTDSANQTTRCEPKTSWSHCDALLGYEEHDVSEEHVEAEEVSRKLRALCNRGSCDMRRPPDRTRALHVSNTSSRNGRQYPLVLMFPHSGRCLCACAAAGHVFVPRILLAGLPRRAQISWGLYLADPTRPDPSLRMARRAHGPLPSDNSNLLSPCACGKAVLTQARAALQTLALR
jgi:hypothetical protein